MSESINSVLIAHICPKNILSFGPENKGIDLKPLNVLIGPNGSGKSNLIEVISLMRAAPKKLEEVTQKGGGVMEWIWKGQPHKSAQVELVMSNSSGAHHLSHTLSFRLMGRRFFLDNETIAGANLPQNAEQPLYYIANGKETPIVYGPGKSPRKLEWDTMSPMLSILAQLSDPGNYPDMFRLAENYAKIRIYREWTIGRNTIIRQPQRADERSDVLEENFSNLGLFLNRIKTQFPAAKRAILRGLNDLYDGINDFDVSIEGSTVQVFITEGDFSIPATRLSDGTLRYLCLLAILCDPEPPPLICIEEPELGLHPDVIPKVADMLKAASKKTQIIVTTHSDFLVDAMSDIPEAVVVCEKHDGQTTMERLNPNDVKVWLEKYRLGQLWISGEIGGTRW